MLSSRLNPARGVIGHAQTLKKGPQRTIRACPPGRRDLAALDLRDHAKPVILIFKDPSSIIEGRVRQRCQHRSQTFGQCRAAAHGKRLMCWRGERSPSPFRIRLYPKLSARIMLSKRSSVRLSLRMRCLPSRFAAGFLFVAVFTARVAMFCSAPSIIG